MATSTIWRLLLQSLPLTVWQSMIRSAIPILSPRERKGKRPIIPTALTFLQAIQRIFSMRWISRTSFRPAIPQVRCSMPFWEKSCRTGRQRPVWCVRSRRIISFHIIPCLPPIPSVKVTAIWQESTLPVRSVSRRQRFTAASQGITVLYRTGMRENFRNIRTV